MGCRTGFYVSDDTNAPPPMGTERTLADRGDGRGMTGAPKRRVSGQASRDAPCRTSRGHEEQQCRARRRMRSARQTQIDRLAECNRWPHLSTMAHEPHTLLPQMPPGELNRKSALSRKRSYGVSLASTPGTRTITMRSTTNARLQVSKTVAVSD